MEEIYNNIQKDIKDLAEIAWQIAVSQKNAAAAANILNIITNYYKRTLTPEEIKFLQFYFNMKMEMMKA